MSRADHDTLLDELVADDQRVDASMDLLDFVFAQGSVDDERAAVSTAVRRGRPLRRRG